MQNPRSQATVHNRLTDQKTSIIVDILAPRRLTKEEMEIHAARALQKLQSENWPKAGEVLTVVAMHEEDGQAETAEYESRWLR